MSVRVDQAGNDQVAGGVNDLGAVGAAGVRFEERGDAVAGLVNRRDKTA